MLLHNFQRILLLLNALIIAFNVHSQGINIPIGDWRLHTPYQNVKSIESVGNKLYAVVALNAYFVDRSDNSLHLLSKINSLNDAAPCKIRYNEPTNQLIIGYESGNIDIITNETTININDIYRKNITGSKKINDITFIDNYAYISFDFGVSVLNLSKLEIKETYQNLAPAGLPNKVYSCAFSNDRDSIFLATEKGIMTAKNSPNINLMDFINWFTYGPSQNIPNTNTKGIINFQDKIFAAIDNDKLYYLQGNSWIPSSIPVEKKFSSMRVSNNKLSICAGPKVLVANNENTFTDYSIPYLGTPNEAIFDTDGIKLWIGDFVQGLHLINGSSYTPFIPNGPITSDVFQMSYHNNSIVVVAGGYSNISNTFLYKRGEFYLFDNYNWNTFNMYYQGFPGYSICRDLVNSTYNPVNKKMYFASYGLGVLVANPDFTFDFLDDTIAPFVRALPTAGPYVFITDVKSDNAGNVWITNSHLPSASNPALHVLKSNGSWTSKSFGIEEARYPIELIIDDNNYKWIRIRPEVNGGIIVYNDKTGSFKYLNDQTGSGGLPKKEVRAIAKDQKGDIWVGTDGGMAVFYNTKNIFSNNIDASIPYFDGFPLLYNESITCIEIDGGNRKWVGTKNGAWLISDDGTELITNFNTSNSPLLSNYIIDIEINDITGEIFFGTDKGIVSYRGDATTATSKYSEVKIFPNPVKPDFNGTLGISGLSKDVSVKITDIYGNLIYQTKAEGGTATWNVKNYNGIRAQPGIYMVFSATQDGTEHFEGKFAVLE